MDKNERLEKHEKERRDFLSCLGSAIACGAATVAANSVTSQAAAAAQETTAASEIPAIPGYDWSKHQWAFGVDAENASAACAASRPARRKTTFRWTRITSAPGSSATSPCKARTKCESTASMTR